MLMHGSTFQIHHSYHCLWYSVFGEICYQLRFDFTTRTIVFGRIFLFRNIWAWS